VPVGPADTAALHARYDPVGFGLGTVDLLYLERFFELLQYHCLHGSLVLDRDSFKLIDMFVKTP
jgi:hypothetical protein